MVEESGWNSNVDLAFQDHSYSTKIKVSAKECVLYYISGYVSKQIQKHTKCNVCLSAFKGILKLKNNIIMLLATLVVAGALVLLKGGNPTCNSATLHTFRERYFIVVSSPLYLSLWSVYKI